MGKELASRAKFYNPTIVKASTYKEADGTVEWIMSDETMDRDGEYISAAGWVVQGKAPVLWGHRSWDAEPDDVIGRVVDSYVEGKTFVGLLKFTRAHETAQKVEEMVADGTLTNGSVGFDPLEWEEADGTKGSRTPGGPYPYPKAERTYTKQDLLEFSIIPVPSNHQAMAKVLDVMREGGVSNEEILEQIAALRQEVAALKASPVIDLGRISAEDWLNVA
jgi:hypothetical protein